MIKICLLHPDAQIPKQGSSGAAGYDLVSVEDKTIPKKGRTLVDTGVSLHIPQGFYGRVASRSGLASRHGIEVGAGVIDSDYRGPLKVILYNHGDEDYSIKKGDKMAQLVITQILHPVFILVESLDESSRGSGGFGSTDRH